MIIHIDRNPIEIENSPCTQCITRAICQSASCTVDVYYKFYMLLSEKCKLYIEYTRYIDRVYEQFGYNCVSSEQLVKLSFPKVKYRQ